MARLLRQAFLGLLTAVWLGAASAPAWANCAKRVVIYLDVSGSMDPLGKQGNRSPYRQSLGAVESLLGAQGLVDPDDVVELVPFGELPEAGQPPATGPQDIKAAIEKVRSHPTIDDTNLGNVITDLAKRLASGRADFTRQLFILASDFAHEPRQVRHDMAGAWEQALSAARPSLEQALQGNPKAAVLLFRAPASGTTRTGETRKALQELVVGDLTKLFGERLTELNVGAGGLDATELGKQLRRQLLSPPDVVPHLAAGDPGGIEVEVSNPNCVPLTLTDVKVQCGEQQVSLPLDGANRQLAASGAADATKRFVAKRPEGSCWATASRFVAEAATGDGLRGRSSGPLCTTLSFKPTAALREDGFLFGHILRLELELRGQYSAPRIYEVQVSDSAKTRIAACRIAAPTDLSPDAEKPYRINLSIHSETLSRLDQGVPVLVSFKDTQDGSVQEASVPVQADDSRSLKDQVGQCTILFCLVVAIIMVVLGLRSQAMGVIGAAPVLAAALLALLALIMSVFRRDLLERLSLTAADRLELAITLLAAAATAFVLVRAVHLSRLTRMVHGEGDFHLDAYLRSMRRGWSAPVAAVLTIVAILAVIWLINFAHPSPPAGHPAAIPVLGEEG